MVYRQIRIYALEQAPYDSEENWAETILARIIRPLAARPEVKWFWFGRYWSEEADFADSNGDHFPADEIQRLKYRSIRFRVGLEDGAEGGFEIAASQLI